MYDECCKYESEKDPWKLWLHMADFCMAYAKRELNISKIKNDSAIKHMRKHLAEHGALHVAVFGGKVKEVVLDGSDHSSRSGKAKSARAVRKRTL
jgi:hypothetical protein